MCGACGGFVTSPTTRVAIDGRHRHHFMNPDGLRFEIGCFSSAPGVVGVGERSTVWTWFPGYAWQAMICRGCARHLGWAYTRERDVFFGLITDRVVESGAPSAS